jgi:polyisoprenoid-binding protein YceI
MFCVPVSRLAAACFAVALIAAPAGAQFFMNHDAAAVHDGDYAIEPEHTRVLFAVSHMGFTTWYGEFTKVSGHLFLPPQSAGSSTLEVHIQTASISNNNATLDEAMKGADWFDSEKYPDMVFKSTAVTQTGPDTADVAGDLTMHGVTRPVTLKARFNASGINAISLKYTVGFEVSGMIRRSDFGVTAYSALVGDDVRLDISAAFEKQ